jgi:hypothetical protein
MRGHGASSIGTYRVASLEVGESNLTLVLHGVDVKSILRSVVALDWLVLVFATVVTLGVFWGWERDAVRADFTGCIRV